MSAALVGLAAALVAAYAAAVGPADARHLERGAWWALTPAAFGAGWLAAVLAARRAPAVGPWLTRGALTAAATVVALLVADNAFIGVERLTGRRRGDAAADLGTRYLGLAISRVYPTGQNFQRYRPNVTASGWRYGDLAGGRFLTDPRLAALVLERRFVRYVIDAHGFRETTPLDRARLFALGDSNTFGSTTQDRTWPKLLEARLGIPVYNLGISAASPRQEFLLLQHLLDTERGRVRVERLVWMISEINDLEDTYDDGAPERRAQGTTRGWLPIQVAVAIGKRLPAAIRERSLIHRLRTGDVRLGTPAPDTTALPEYFFDGYRLPAPMYQAPGLGAKILHPAYIANAARASPEYVRQHPNRPRLERTFRDMAALARRERFAVTVVIAPSDVRLYARPLRVSPDPAAPAMSALVAALAAANGFALLDLGPRLAPFAEREMLYYRDDTHWNERGNQLVADLIAAFLAATP